MTSKIVPIIVHDSSGKVLGTLDTKPNSSLWRVTKKGPGLCIRGVRLWCRVVGHGHEAQLHVTLPDGVERPRKLRPIAEQQERKAG